MRISISIKWIFHFSSASSLFFEFKPLSPRSTKEIIISRGWISLCVSCFLRCAGATNVCSCQPSIAGDGVLQESILDICMFKLRFLFVLAGCSFVASCTWSSRVWLFAIHRVRCQSVFLFWRGFRTSCNIFRHVDLVRINVCLVMLVRVCSDVPGIWQS